MTASWYVAVLHSCCYVARASVIELWNPQQLFDLNGFPMNVHDGDIRQWEDGGPFYYYGMQYHRCRYTHCASPTCSHNQDHKVVIYRSMDLATWELVQSSALPGSENGTFATMFRPHVLYNRNIDRYLMFVNTNVSGLYHYTVSFSTTPEGPFTNPVAMGSLAWRARHIPSTTEVDFGDMGFFADDDGAGYIAYNMMDSTPTLPGGIHVERLNTNFTDGMYNSSQVSACLNCAVGSPQESPLMYKTSQGEYVVLTAGATCFGVPQLPADFDAGKDGPAWRSWQEWGGVGIFAYKAATPLGPYEYIGDINSISGKECGVCPGNPCPSGKCALQVQLNSVIRRYDGSPVALTGSMWARNMYNRSTDILGDYAEYWQPWDEVVNSTTGLPRPLRHLDRVNLSLEVLSSPAGTSRWI